MGYLLGFAVGVGMIVGFARHQHTRSTRPTDLVAAIAIAALARMSDQDSRKLLPDKSYRERQFNGLNNHLDKLWSFRTNVIMFEEFLIIDGESDEVIIELKMQWDGNTKIVLDIRPELVLHYLNRK